jgi:hypothetical protein
MTIKIETTKTCEILIPSRKENFVVTITEFSQEKFVTIKIGELTTKLVWNPTQLKYRGYIGGFEILTFGPQTSVKLVKDKIKKKK